MYCIQGSGGDDCDLIVSDITDNGQCAMFKSATQPGAHIEVLPNGYITSTTEATQSSDASLFKVRRIVSVNWHNSCAYIQLLFLHYKWIIDHQINWLSLLITRYNIPLDNITKLKLSNTENYAFINRNHWVTN